MSIKSSLICERPLLYVVANMTWRRVANVQSISLYILCIETAPDISQFVTVVVQNELKGMVNLEEVVTTSKCTAVAEWLTIL